MYTIQVLRWGVGKRDQVKAALLAAVAKDGRFRILGTSEGEVQALPTLYLHRVRLADKKPYCGNHPGPCEINPFRPQEKKKNTVYLEWDDWVAFHGLVNKVLNKLRCHADVWTLPQDARGRFWIRKDLSPRVKFDYTEEYVGGRPLRIWNTGDSSQFQKEV